MRKWDTGNRCECALFGNQMRHYERASYPLSEIDWDTRCIGRYLIMDRKIRRPSGRIVEYTTPQ